MCGLISRTTLTHQQKISPPSKCLSDWTVFFGYSWMMIFYFIVLVKVFAKKIRSAHDHYLKDFLFFDEAVGVLVDIEVVVDL